MTTSSSPPTSGEDRGPGPEASAPYVKSRLNRKWLVTGSIAGSTLVLGLVIALVVVLSGSSGPSYEEQVTQSLLPVMIDNGKINTEVAALTADSSPDALKAEIANADSDTRSARREIKGFDAPDASQAATVNSALSAELTWLQTAKAVLENPASALAPQLSSLGISVSGKLDDLRAIMPSLRHATFPASEPIITYASAATASGLSKFAAIDFSNKVSALLDQSESSFQLVNDFFNQLQIVVNGGEATFTVPQAEQQIGSIIANRNALAASAQAITAPTPDAQNVVQLLVAAFNASLKDDNALSDCLNQENYGTVAYIYSSCLDSTRTYSYEATNAKQAFLSAFNALRSSIGQPPIDKQF